MRITKWIVGLLLMGTASLSSANIVDGQIQAFVKNWFASFDTNAPEQVFLDRLASQDLEMVFPEATIASHADFHTWYTNIQRNIQQASHQVKSVRILQRHSDYTVLDVRVLWKAKTYEGKHLEFNAKQTWTIINEQNVIKIKKYIVTEDTEAKKNPGLFSAMNTGHAKTLTCTCYGGPGNYPYDCAPKTTTCYGGPGNYPYPCRVCLQ